jgi:hypothetical protein
MNNYRIYGRKPFTKDAFYDAIESELSKKSLEVLSSD